MSTSDRGRSSAWRRGVRGRAVGVVLALAALGTAEAGASAPSAPSWSDWNAWGYHASQTRPTRDFNVSFRPTLTPFGRTRVAFCAQDPQDYYFLELGPGECYLGKTESGVERALAPLGVRLADLLEKEMVIQRRSLRIDVLVNGRLVAGVDDELFQGGDVAFGGRKSGLKLEQVKVQPIGEVYFADDFMRVQEEAGPWRTLSGEWGIKALKNPGLSINAFSYLGSGKPGVAVTGYPFWGDVEFSLACRPRGSAVVGLYVAYHDPKNYYLFRWYSRKAETPVRQFVRCRDGREEVLAESPGGHLSDQWYEISAWYGGGWALVNIDETPVFAVADDGLTQGLVGLYAESEVGVEYDDVLVRSQSAFAEDFNGAATGRWTAHGGAWSYLASGAPWFGGGADRKRLVRAAGTALDVAGDSRWRSYVLSADVGPWEGGALGLAFAVTNGSDYYSAEWGEEALELCKTLGGKRTVLASSKRPKPSGPVRMTVRFEGGRIRLAVDGKAAVECHDPDLTGGQIGLLARDAGMGVFDNVAVRPLSPAEPLFSVHEVFSNEISMEVWSDALSDWHIVRDAKATAAVTEMTVGRNCAIVFFDAGNPADAVLVAVYD